MYKSPIEIISQKGRQLNVEIRMFPDYRKLRLKSEPVGIPSLSDEEMKNAIIALYRQFVNSYAKSHKKPNVYFNKEICEEAVRLGIMDRRNDGSYLYNGYTVIHPKEFDGEMMYGK